MRLGSIGGVLVIAGSLLLVVVGAMALGGSSIAAAQGDPGGLVLLVALTLIGVGAGLIGLSGPPPLRGGMLRVGLVLLAAGVLAVVATARVSISSVLVVVFLVGASVAWIGGLLTIGGLLRVTGRPRHCAVAVIGGAALAAVGSGLVSSFPGSAVVGAAGLVLAAAGLGVAVLGVAWVGLVAIGRSAQATPTT